MTREQFETTWIVPKLPNSISESAKRLVAYLYVNSNITAIFVDDYFNGKVIFENDYFLFGKGKGTNSSVNVNGKISNIIFRE